jgi:hypothetical protein
MSAAMARFVYAVMICRRWRAAALAIPAKVGTHDGEFARQERRDVTPHQMRLRKAVEKEHRRAGACPSHKDPRFRRVDQFARETIEHRCLRDDIPPQM